MDNLRNFFQRRGRIFSFFQRRPKAFSIPSSGYGPVVVARFKKSEEQRAWLAAPLSFTLPAVTVTVSLRFNRQSLFRRQEIVKDDFARSICFRLPRTTFDFEQCGRQYD